MDDSPAIFPSLTDHYAGVKMDCDYCKKQYPEHDGSYLWVESNNRNWTKWCCDDCRALIRWQTQSLRRV